MNCMPDVEDSAEGKANCWYLCKLCCDDGVNYDLSV